MTRLLDRIAAANGVVARCADWAIARVLPAVTSEAASCYWRCTGLTCLRTDMGDFYKECLYCTAGYWTGDCRCAFRCR